MPAPLKIATLVRDASLADLDSEHRAEPVQPEPEGLMTDVDPALGQRIPRRYAATADIARTLSRPDG